MDNLENWEVLRLGAYNIFLLGALFFLVGSLFDAATFGANRANQSLLVLIVDTFHNTGTGAMGLGGALTYFTGGG